MELSLKINNWCANSMLKTYLEKQFRFAVFDLALSPLVLCVCARFLKILFWFCFLLFFEVKRNLGSSLFFHNQQGVPESPMELEVHHMLRHLSPAPFVRAGVEPWCLFFVSKLG